MDEKKIIELYDFFNNEGYNIGDLDNFKRALLLDSPRREELYNFFDAEGYNLGEFDNFFLSPSQDMVSESAAGGSEQPTVCLLYTSPSPRDRTRSRMPSSA